MLLKMVICSTRYNIRHISNKIDNVRKMSFIPGIRPKRMNEQHYLIKDEIPPEYTLIYKAPMETYLSLSKNITTLTASIVSFLVGYRLYTGDEIKNLPEESAVADLITSGSDLLIFASGFLFITLALRVFISKYPLRIYKNKTCYIAVFQGQLPLKYSKVYFNQGEIGEVKPNIFNPWAQSMYRMRNKNVIIFIDYFKTPAEFNNMIVSRENKSSS